MTYSFYNDYSEGAHPKILQALVAGNDDQHVGYGLDEVSALAAAHIRRQFSCPSADIHFVSAGTQANLVTLQSMLRPYEAVVCVDSGHIAVHEAGSVEATGHKVITVPNMNGKLLPERLAAVCDEHTDEHMVAPKVAYISQSTEMGTVYSKEEIEALSAVCKARGLYLYIDGARLASALVATEGGLAMPDIARLADAFYIGGTKNGALCGEAIVLVHPDLQKNFRFHLKQRGALLAKGRTVGVQFEAFFQDDTYLEIARHANAMSRKLADGIRALGYPFLSESVTNIQLPIFPNAVVEALKRSYGFHPWAAVDEAQTCIRLVTSWATREEMVEAFLAELERVGGEVV